MFLIAALLFLALPKLAYAQVKIKDYCADCDIEWVDIKNIGTTEIQTDLWYLVDESGHKLFLNGYLNIDEIKRYEHNKGWLNNDQDTIYLKDNLENIIDQLSYPTPSASPSATPTPTTEPSPTATPSATPTPTTTPTPTPVENLIINEIMPNPETGNEWAEILNSNSFPVIIDGWHLLDSTNNSRLISGVTIPEYSYFIYNFSSYFLNNDKDSISLFDQFNRQIGESFSYTKTEKGLSYSLEPDDTWCLSIGSSSQDNNSCYVPTSTPTPTPTPTKVPTPTKIPTPTKVPTPIKIKTPKPTKTPTLAKIRKTIKSPTKIIIKKQEISPTITSEVTILPVKEAGDSNIVPFTFIGFGALLLLSPLILL